MDCAEPLQLAYAQILHDFRAETGHDLLLTCTYRSVEEQAALYAQGRTKPGPRVTNLDGVTHKSNHNYTPARALDVCVLVQGKVSWDPAQYAPLGELAKRYGLVWGGAWQTLKDYPHLELPVAVVSSVAPGTGTPSYAP
jgi:peptidoglycan LD-endopeptidase CwlK